MRILGERAPVLLKVKSSLMAKHCAKDPGLSTTIDSICPSQWIASVTRFGYAMLSKD
jgi:hypothetical protein